MKIACTTRSNRLEMPTRHVIRITFNAYTLMVDPIIVRYVMIECPGKTY